jgi:hypothetical protein
VLLDQHRSRDLDAVVLLHVDAERKRPFPAHRARYADPPPVRGDPLGRRGQAAKMAFAGIKDEQKIRDLIAYLPTYDKAPVKLSQ